MSRTPTPPEGVELHPWVRGTPSEQIANYLKSFGIPHIPANGAAAHLKHLALNGRVTADDWYSTVQQAAEHQGDGVINFSTRAADTGSDVSTSQPPAFPPIGTTPSPDEDITEWVLSMSVPDLRQVVYERFHVLDPATREMKPSDFVTDEDITTLVAVLRRAKRQRVTRGQYLQAESEVRKAINLRIGLTNGTVRQTGTDNYEARYILHQIDHGSLVATFTSPLVATVSKTESGYEYRLHSYEGTVRQGNQDVRVTKNGEVDITAATLTDDWRDAQRLVYTEFFDRYERGDESIRAVVARMGGNL